MRTGSKLVDKVWILALLFVAPFAIIACGGKSGPAIEPSQIIAAADSADKAIEGKIAVLRDSASKPSVFFDTIYKYYASARMIEVQKRIEADSLAKAAVLAIDNVKDAALRSAGIKRLSSFLSRDSVRLHRRDSLRSSLSTSLGRMLDSSNLTVDEKQKLLSEISSTSRLEPEYRSELDSLTHGTIEVELEILHFLDEAARRIKIEDVLKFSDPNDLARYQMLTSKLAELAAAQQVLVDRITYGVQLPDSTDEPADTSTVKQVPEIKPPVQTWPDAVRMQ